jgi:RND family efflux transporter MFP subunit
VSTASIYSLASEDRARKETAAWAKFSAPQDQAEFCASWLAILCSQIERVNAALLLLAAGSDGAFAPAAIWPDAKRDVQYLGVAAETALKERHGVVLAADGTPEHIRDQAAHVAYPVDVAGHLYGVVVLDIPPGAEPELQRALRLTHWAIAWLADRYRQQMLAEQGERTGRLALVSDLVATTLQEERLAAAAHAVVNELVTRLGCNRASIGFEKNGSIQLRAISNTATFEPKSNHALLISEAMNEVLDLDVARVYPPGTDDELGVMAHAALAKEAGNSCVCSVPLIEREHAMGVITLERREDQPFTAPQIELCKTLGMLLGPVLALKLEKERPFWQRAREFLRGGMRALFGPRHPGAKLIAVALAAVIVFFSVVEGEYRVSATTVIEGAVQRAAVTPFDGYVAESLVRAGDVVQQGQVLCRLDTRDLVLERTKWLAEREQLLNKHRQALAVQDRAQMGMLGAQINQTEAQLSLVEERLARATLIAPFEGIVVSGDLSQLLGTPVEQGKVLFEIAPLDAYRVILKVDERDIADVRTGQTGELALSGIPNEVMQFSVKQMTPVTTSQDGRNYYRIEAHIDRPSERLRPGMEGVGKISIGESKLIWIWTHAFVDWLRIWTWNWLP